MKLTFVRLISTSRPPVIPTLFNSNLVRISHDISGLGILAPNVQLWFNTDSIDTLVRFLPSCSSLVAFCFFSPHNILFDSACIMGELSFHPTGSHTAIAMVSGPSFESRDISMSDDNYLYSLGCYMLTVHIVIQIGRPSRLSAVSS